MNFTKCIFCHELIDERNESSVYEVCQDCFDDKTTHGVTPEAHENFHGDGKSYVEYLRAQEIGNKYATVRVTPTIEFKSYIKAAMNQTSKDEEAF